MKLDPIFPIALIVFVAWIVFIIRIITLYLIANNPSFSYKSRWQQSCIVTRWLGLTVALLCLIFTAYRPVYVQQFHSESQIEKNQKNENIFLVIDSSPSMKTQDFGGKITRLEKARKDALDIIVNHPQAHISLITYGSSARLDWPLTQDIWGLTQFTRSLAGYDTTTYSDMQTTDPWEPAKYVKAQIVTQHTIDPLTMNWVYFFSDGDPFTTHPTDKDAAIKYSDIPYINGGLSLLYGTNQGGHVIAFIVDNKPMLVDLGNEPLVAKTNPEIMKSIAQKMGLEYIPRTDNSPVEPIVDQNMLKPNNLVMQSNDRSSVLPLYWVLAIIAAILLGIELICLVFNSSVIPRLFPARTANHAKRKES